MNYAAAITAHLVDIRSSDPLIPVFTDLFDTDNWVKIFPNT